jgi:hypothetical protein
MEPSLYEKIHTNPKRFIVIHGHQVTRVEQVVVTKPNYMVVEKYVLPPPTAGTLNATGVKNT